jgi:hypothetical protein
MNMSRSAGPKFPSGGVIKALTTQASAASSDLIPTEVVGLSTFPQDRPLTDILRFQLTVGDKRKTTTLVQLNPVKIAETLNDATLQAIIDKRRRAKDRDTTKRLIELERTVKRLTNIVNPPIPALENDHTKAAIL